jgi:Protein of unknown function (DUF2934)
MKAVRMASEAGEAMRTASPEAESIPAKPRAAKAKAAAAALGGGSMVNLSVAVNGGITPEQVAERAYFRWLERGCPMGSAEEDWFQAEQELGAGR